MQKKITQKVQISILVALFAWLGAHSQAITIEAADMPVPTDFHYYDNIIGLAVPAPVIGQGEQWDYSAYFGNTPNSANYFQETIPFFTDAGVDVYRSQFKNLNDGFGYFTWQEIDFNDNAIDDIAVDVSYQAYTLQPFTGNAGDSLFILPQSYILDEPKRLIEFPFTNNSAWSSSSRRVTDMLINVPLFGLNNTPVTQAYTWVRHDTIIGYGKMRLYTADGPSIEYDVLMDKISEYTIDSFYLAGQPAPPTLLNAFGLSQGQKTNINNRYVFYRKGTFAYLLGFIYESDDSFSNPVDIFVHTDDIETYNSTFEIENITYSTLLYPNPSNGSEINVKIMGGIPVIDQYSITDVFGRTIQEGMVDVTAQNAINIVFPNRLAAGNYFISLKKGARCLVTESFHVIEK